MKLVYSATAFLLIALAGCKEQEAQFSELEQAAMTAVRAQAKDPESVQFRGVRIVDLTTSAGPAQIVCGEFNAKNGFGGYGGFEQFTWHSSGKLLAQSMFPASSAELIGSAITDYCSGKLPSIAV